MKTIVLTYSGFLNGKYLFRDENNKKFEFLRLRVDLIKEFDLQSKANCDKKFEVRYFEVERNDKIVPIVSNLELMS